LFYCRYKALHGGVAKVFSAANKSSMPRSEFVSQLSQISLVFSESELEAGLARLADDNRVMVADDVVFLI